MNQAYRRFSTTHGHITYCKLDSVVYAGVIKCVRRQGTSFLLATNKLRSIVHDLQCT